MTEPTLEQIADYKARLAWIKQTHAEQGARLNRFKALMVAGQRVPQAEFDAYDAIQNAYDDAVEALGAELGFDLTARRQARLAHLAVAEAMAEDDPDAAAEQASALITGWASEDHGVPLGGSRRTGGTP